MAGRKIYEKHNLSKGIIQSLYPIAHRNGSLLPSFFKQGPKPSNINNLESLLSNDLSNSAAISLTLEDIRSQSDGNFSPKKMTTDRPIPFCCSIYYYELTINSKDACGSLLVGFSSSDAGKALHSTVDRVLGYNINSGQILWTDKPLPSSGPAFGEGDVIGCGINFVTNSAFFTKNGVLISNLTAPVKFVGSVYPCVVQLAPSTRLTCNFGQHSFCFEIRQHIAQERSNAVCQAIDKHLTSDLANVQMQRIVFDYLLRHGCLDTAQMLMPDDTTETKRGPDALQSSTDDESAYFNHDHSKVKVSVVQSQFASSESKATGWQLGDEVWPETPEMVRRRIQLAGFIEAGHYEEAISRLNTDHPNLTEHVPSLVFMLRCRHFIELLFAYQTRTQNSIDKSSTIVQSQHGVTNKRAQPTSSPEFSPISSQNGFATLTTHVSSPAPIRMKLDEACLNEEGESEEEEEGGNGLEFPEEFLDGPIGVQAAASAQNEVSIIKKQKKKALMNLFKYVPDHQDSINIPSNNIFYHNCDENMTQMLNPPVDNGEIDESSESDSSCESCSDGLDNAVDQIAPELFCSENLEEISLTDLVMLGRELRETAQQLQTNNAISSAHMKLLEEAFSLVAYDNPFESPFFDLAHVRHRKILAESVNNAVLVDMGKARYPLLETSIGLLEQTMLDPKQNISEFKSAEAPPSSSGTLTPQRQVHRQQSTSTSASDRHRHHHRRRSHRSQGSSSLMVTSTSTGNVTSETAIQTVHQVYPASFFQHSPTIVSSAVSASGEQVTTAINTATTPAYRPIIRLRNTVVQSSPMYRIGYYSSSSSTEGGYSQTLPPTPRTPLEPSMTHQSRPAMITRDIPSSSSAQLLSSPSCPIGGEREENGTDGVGFEFAGFFHPALFLV